VADFKLSIVTPERVSYEADVSSLVVPGIDGYLGVLANHAPLITAMKPGKIEFRDPAGKVLTIAVSGGFLEVSGNVATVLADTAEFGSEIDLDRAKKTYERERARFLEAASGTDSSIDVNEARQAMERAKNRIQIAEQMH
jgi:F-type H+-transporting ATPase subunit epsilon